jgi:hypothetical protein
MAVIGIDAWSAYLDLPLATRTSCPAWTRAWERLWSCPDHNIEPVMRGYEICRNISLGASDGENARRYGPEGVRFCLRFMDGMLPTMSLISAASHFISEAILLASKPFVVDPRQWVVPVTLFQSPSKSNTCCTLYAGLLNQRSNNDPVLYPLAKDNTKRRMPFSRIFLPL